jgi:hypothetical protein
MLGGDTHETAPLASRTALEAIRSRWSLACDASTSPGACAGGTAALGTTLSNSPSSTYNLNYTLGAAVQSGAATLGKTAFGAGSLAPGSSQSCTVPATSSALGVNTLSFAASDPNASNSPQTTYGTLTVLDHAAAAFADGSGTLNLDFGTVQRGTSTRQFQIQNLAAAYRAGLDLDSVTEHSDLGGVFSTGLMSFTNLAPGDLSDPLDLTLTDLSQVGQFSGQYRFNLSDEKDLSGHAGQQTLILNVTATVVPEAGTISLFLATVALLGAAAGVLRKRGAGLADRRSQHG